MAAKSRNFLIIGLVIAAILAGTAYYFFREEPLEETKRESVVSRMAFTGSELTEEKDGKRIWELTARIIEVDPKTRLVYLTDLKGRLYREDGTKIEMTAKTAVADPTARSLEFSEGLEMKADDGASLKAGKGRYSGEERKIYATGSVRATREDVVLTANELETDDRFAKIVVKGNARIVKGGPQP